MDFERRIGVFSDGGPAAKIGNGRSPFSADPRLHGVHAERRQLFVFDGDIGRGEAELTAEALAFDHRSEHGVLAAKETRGFGEITFGNRLADERAADDIAVDFQRRDAIDGKIVLLTQFHQQVDISFTLVAETPCVADGDAA
jgi:hypothetical protein